MADLRFVSSKVFGNEKLVEVALDLAARRAPATATDVAQTLGVSHSTVRDVLLRLEAAGMVRALSKIGGSRSAQYYTPSELPDWIALVGLCHALREPAVNIES